MTKTPKQSPKKKVEKKENSMALAVKSERALQWGGVMPKVGNNENDQQKLNVFVNQVAKIYGVPSLGVNAMGGQPYLNKDGRLYLLYDLRTGKSGLKAIRKEFLQMSRSFDEPSIIKVTLVFRDGHEVEAIGEASKQSVKLENVKQTLNLMAETRGLNRAIWQEIGGDVWKRVAKNIERSKMSEDEKARVVNAGQVSYEEMTHVESRGVSREKPKASTPEQLTNLILDSIKRCADWSVVVDIDKKAQESEKLNMVQKAEIHKAATARVDELDK